MALGGIVTKKIASVAITAGTPASVWTPTAGKKFRLVGWSLGVTVAAAAIIFKEGAGPTDVGGGLETPVLAINATDTRERLGEGVLSAAADNVLKLDVSVSSTVTGYVFGYEE